MSQLPAFLAGSKEAIGGLRSFPGSSALPDIQNDF
jgi:hypothetical protein